MTEDLDSCDLLNVDRDASWDMLYYEAKRIITQAKEAIRKATEASDGMPTEKN